MSKEKEGKQKSGKTPPSSSPKEKKAVKRAKRDAKKERNETISYRLDHGTR